MGEDVVKGCRCSQHPLCSGNKVVILIRIYDISPSPLFFFICLDLYCFHYPKASNNAIFISRLGCEYKWDLNRVNILHLCCLTQDIFCHLIVTTSKESSGNTYEWMSLSRHPWKAQSFTCSLHAEWSQATVRACLPHLVGLVSVNKNGGETFLVLKVPSYATFTFLQCFLTLICVSVASQ